jgi:hypothetical protein
VYYECLPTHLNPLAERTCYPQVHNVFHLSDAEQDAEQDVLLDARVQRLRLLQGPPRDESPARYNVGGL